MPDAADIFRDATLRCVDYTMLMHSLRLPPLMLPPDRALRCHYATDVATCRSRRRLSSPSLSRHATLIDCLLTPVDAAAAHATPRRRADAALLRQMSALRAIAASHAVAADVIAVCHALFAIPRHAIILMLPAI